MGLLFCDSFDHYATADMAAKYPLSTNLSAAQIGAFGRRAGNGARALNGNFNLQVAVPSPPSTVVVGFACRIATLSQTPVILNLGESGLVHLGIKVNADGSVSVCRMSSGQGPPAGVVQAVLGSTAAGVITNNNYVYYELKAKIDSTVGTVELHLAGNSTPVINLTNQNTRTGGNGVVSVFSLCATSATNVDFDDVYLLDTTGTTLNNFLGDVRVDARTVTGAGTLTQWTPLSGANYQNVNDATPNGDTSYNSAPSTNLTDTYLVQAAPLVGVAPLGVQLCADIKKTDAGACTVAPVVRASGTSYPGTAQNLVTSYTYLVQPYSLNPATGAAWTEAGFNASEFGLQRVS